MAKIWVVESSLRRIPPKSILSKYGEWVSKEAARSLFLLFLAPKQRTNTYQVSIRFKKNKNSSKTFLSIDPIIATILKVKR
jgi:hypothetical protein